MNTIITWIVTAARTRAVVVAVIGFLTVVAGWFGYEVSPELREAVQALIEALTGPLAPDAG